MAAAKKKPAKKAAKKPVVSAQAVAKRKAGRNGRADSVQRDARYLVFAAAWLRYGNNVRAYREAVPETQANDETVRKEAWKLFHDERTQAHIDELRKRAAARAEATLAEWVANELKLARSDPARLFDDEGHLLPIAEIDPDTRHAIQAIDVEEEKTEVTEEDGTLTTVRTRVKKVKLHSKDGAQDRLGKYVGAYQRDNEQQNIVTQLLAKVPAANLAMLEDLLRGCGGDAGHGGEATAGGPPAAARSGQ